MDMQKEIEVAIGMYFYNTGFNAMDVTALSVEYEDTTPVISLTTRRPGLLIGRRGEYIDSLRVRVSDEIGLPVKFKIIENTLWNSVPLAGDSDGFEDSYEEVSDEHAKRSERQHADHGRDGASISSEHATEGTAGARGRGGADAG